MLLDDSVASTTGAAEVRKNREGDRVAAATLDAADLVFGSLSMLATGFAVWFWLRGDTTLETVLLFAFMPVFNLPLSALSRRWHPQKAELIRAAVAIPTCGYTYVATAGVFEHWWLWALLYAIGQPLMLSMRCRRFWVGAVVGVGYALALLVAHLVVHGREHLATMSGHVFAVLLCGLACATVASRIVVLFDTLAAQKAALEASHKLADNRTTELRQFLAQMPAGVFVVDATGSPFFANDEARRIMAGSPTIENGWRGPDQEYHAHRRGQPGVPYPPEELPLAFALRGETKFADDIDVIGPAGPVPIHATAAPIFDADGAVAFALVLFEDVTERLQQEQTRLRLEQDRLQGQKLESVGQLAAGIAHEINTPMQYISNNTNFMAKGLGKILDALRTYEAILDETAPPDAVARAAEAARRLKIPALKQRLPKAIDANVAGVAAVAKIVSAMKAFSHPGREERTLVDLNAALENTLTISRSAWKYVADLALHLDPDLPKVPGLPSELNQVFVNIVVNAGHAIADARAPDDPAPTRGTITVTTRTRDDACEIAIADTGCGIPDAIRQKIFDPFFTTKEVGRGTGQGLAIARSIVVDQHHGELRVDSRPGEGTTFTIVLPRVGAAGGHPEEKAA